MNFKHITVLEDEAVANLNLESGDLAVDCTGGGGGHSRKILDKIGKKSHLLIIDRDPQACAHLRLIFAKEIKSQQVIVEHARFSQLKQIIKNHQLQSPKAILADIGVSSHQIDTADRGFSFQKEGPLDMRMDQSPKEAGVADFINNADINKIAEVIKTCGQEPHAKRIAQAIDEQRKSQKITTTAQLAELIKSVYPYKYSKKHPATRTFQALRIYINQELQELESLLTQGFDVLSSKGRLAIIAFHSLEDSLVKAKFKALANKNLPSWLNRDIPLTPTQITSYTKTKGKLIKPFPIKASKQDIKDNPRCRSAVLRIIEKL